MKKARWQRLKRLTNLSAWRFLSLVATDPRYDQLYANLESAVKLPLLSVRKPWLAMDAVKFAEQAVLDNSRVFEWGSGASTLWFEDKGCSVVSYEHDEQWHKLVEEKVSVANVILCDDQQAYTNPKIDVSEFDVFLIDGRHRAKCADFLISKVAEGDLRKALIIFDDSNRHQYRLQLLQLSELACRSISLGGANGVEMTKMTTFFWL